MPGCGKHLLDECPVCYEVDWEKARAHAALVNPNRAGKPKKVRQKSEGDLDPMILEIAEYASGYRCMKCGGIRDDHGMCQHQRDARFEAEKRSIMAFARANPGPFGRFTAAAAMRRAMLRSGLRETQVPGLEIPRAAWEAVATRKAVGIEPSWREHRVSDPQELPL